MRVVYVCPFWFMQYGKSCACSCGEFFCWGACGACDCACDGVHRPWSCMGMCSKKVSNMSSCAADVFRVPRGRTVKTRFAVVSRSSRSQTFQTDDLVFLSLDRGCVNYGFNWRRGINLHWNLGGQISHCLHKNARTHTYTPWSARVEQPLSEEGWAVSHCVPQSYRRGHVSDRLFHRSTCSAFKVKGREAWSMHTCESVIKGFTTVVCNQDCEWYVWNDTYLWNA